MEAKPTGRLPGWTRSLRLRLAVAVTLLMTAVLALVGLATHQLLRQSLLDGIAADVTHRAATFQANHPTPPYDLDVFGAPDVYLQVVRADGSAVFARSGNLGQRNLPLPVAAREGAVVKVKIAGQPLFLTAAPLDDDRYVVVARSAAATYGTLRTLRQLLIGFGTAAILLTAGASWLLARAALRPIERLVEVAAAVRDSRDLAHRVSHEGRQDELGQLTETFNDMLATLADAFTSLEDAYTGLDRSHQQMRQFLADCSHELRTSLARIRSTIDVLDRTDGAGTDGEIAFRSQALADFTEETDRMAWIVRPLLILARADAGATIEPHPVRAGQVVADACRHARRMATGQTLVTPPDETLSALDDVPVCGDAAFVEQVLLILLDNAFKYTPPSGEVRVDAHTADAGGGWLRISVTDTGPGVPPEDADRIFERFYRGRNGRLAAGFGIGLAIARWVVEQHQGRIEHSRPPDGGSRFSVFLPVLRARPGEPATRDETTSYPVREEEGDPWVRDG